jgi:hypothetical protein
MLSVNNFYMKKIYIYCTVYNVPRLGLFFPMVDGFYANWVFDKTKTRKRLKQ